MQRSSPIWIAFAVAALGAIGCADEGVGDPCVPETVPCNAEGKECGYKSTEAYIEATSVQCRSRLCIVYKLDNNFGGTAPSDPRSPCTGKASDSDSCVDDESLARSVYCTIRCTSADDCPGEFTCEPVLALGGPGIRGSYCVKREAIENAM
jgi:hypothetical protein